MNDKQYRHNGRFARKNIIEWKQKLSKTQKKGRAIEKSNVTSISLSDLGRRILDLTKLGNDM